MSIKINSNKCTGCGKCRVVCPGSLLVKDKESNKTFIRHPDECWGCTSCLKECNYEAISYYLGDDMGGQGSLMYISRSKDEKDNFNWIVVKKDGTEERIVIDKTKANSY